VGLPKKYRTRFGWRATAQRPRTSIGHATDFQRGWAPILPSGAPTSEPLPADLPNCEFSHTLAPFSLHCPAKQLCRTAAVVRQ
jgi:hypothetical protein